MGFRAKEVAPQNGRQPANWARKAGLGFRTLLAAPFLGILLCDVTDVQVPGTL